MSIRYKIFSILLVIALVVLAAFASTYHFYSQKALRKVLFGNLEAIANVQHQRIRDFLEYNQEMLSLISSRTQLRILTERYQERHDNVSFSMLTRILSDAIRNSQNINAILLMGKEGTLIASTPGAHVGSADLYLQLFRSGREAPASSLIKNKNLQAPLIFFSAPLHQDGRFIGVVAIQVDTHFFDAFMRDDTGLGKSGEVLLATRTEEGDMLFFTPLRFHSFPMLVDKASADAVPMRNALMKRERTFENALDYRHKRVIALTRYLKELDLGIVIKIDRDEVLSTYDEMQRFIVESVLIMVLVVFFASLVLSRMITRPVIDITRAAQRISEGEFGHRVHTSGRDELGQLAASLNQMADRLINANRSLEQKVREKTAALQRANAQLGQLAEHDELTAVANRRKFNEHLQQEWYRCMRTQTPLSLIMFDLDFFKKVNDLMGHQQGDDYLKRIAAILKASVRRPGDLAARYGGEEFAVILENTSSTDALKLAEAICRRVQEAGLKHPYPKIAPHLTVSAGVATAVPRRDAPHSRLLKAADEALYRAKSEGRNRVCAAGDPCL